MSVEIVVIRVLWVAREVRDHLVHLDYLVLWVNKACLVLPVLRERLETRVSYPEYFHSSQRMS